MDEAHCIASWGHDFRPDYLRLGAIIDAFGARPAVAALTATAAPPVRQEIMDRLGLRDPRQVIRDFDRPEIHLAVRMFHRADDKQQAVLDAVREQTGSGLVYAGTRKEAEAYGGLLGVRHYHGGLSRADRARAQEDFERGATIVATSAFGMGIDRPDVRFVVHAAVPGSLDEYYQEIGRCGRDGRPAVAICCYRAEDLGLLRYFASGLPDHDDLAAVARAVDGPLTRSELAARTGLPAGHVAGLLNLLEAAGAVRIRRQVEPAADRPGPGEAADRAVEIAAQHRSVERSRVEMMRRYAEMTDCRRRFLLRYFGEPVSKACGACDNCDAGRSKPVVPGRPVFPRRAGHPPPVGSRPGARRRSRPAHRPVRRLRLPRAGHPGGIGPAPARPGMTPRPVRAGTFSRPGVSGCRIVRIEKLICHSANQENRSCFRYVCCKPIPPFTAVFRKW